MNKTISALFGVGVAIATFGSAYAQDSVAEFYAGNTITIKIAYPPGGSYDQYARLGAQFLGKHIPGNPNIIVQNLSGGAGTLRQFIDSEVNDGTVLAIFPETIGIVQLTDPVTGQWDVRDLAYVGSFAGVNAAMFMRGDSGIESLDDFKTKPMNVGCNSPISQSYTNPAMLKNTLGYQFNIICGYPGNSEFPSALLRGEIDMVSANWTGWKNRSEVLDGTFVVAFQSGLRRHPDLLDVPLMQELVEDPKHKQAIELWSAGSAIGRALVVHSTAPQDRIDALRKAFDDMMADPELIAFAAQINLEIDATPGIEVQRISEAILDTPEDVIAVAIEIVK